MHLTFLRDPIRKRIQIWVQEKATGIGLRKISKQIFVASKFASLFFPIYVSLHILQVYELVGQKWTDRGTAFCQGEYDEEARQARLIARAEHNNDILLQCIIRATDVYQRQQGNSLCLFPFPHDFQIIFSLFLPTLFNIYFSISDTLIVWTEPDGSDYALSFQDIDGCSEVWEFIAEVQRHLQDKGAS